MLQKEGDDPMPKWPEEPLREDGRRQKDEPLEIRKGRGIPARPQGGHTMRRTLRLPQVNLRYVSGGIVEEAIRVIDVTGDKGELKNFGTGRRNRAGESQRRGHGSIRIHDG